MENNHFKWVNPREMAIFNSYVSLPEGIQSKPEKSGVFYTDLQSPILYNCKTSGVYPFFPAISQ